MTPGLPPTLALRNAIAEVWDCVVIGAGPAGVVAAQQLAQRGATVLLIERKTFPREKVCGGCLNSRGLEVLRAARLAAIVQSIPQHSIERFELHCGGHAATLSLPGGLVVARDALDTALAGAAISAGAAFLPETLAVVGESHAEVVEVHLQHGAESGIVQARVVLCADGLARQSLRDRPDFSTNVAPAARVGVGARLSRLPLAPPPGVIFMALAAVGYVGMVQLAGGELNLAAALDVAAIRSAGGVGPAVAAILATAGIDDCSPIAAATWQGTPPLTSRLSRPAAHRVLVIGDAASYIEPFTGEGMTWAFASGAAAARIADEGRRQWRPALEKFWMQEQRRILGSGQWRCRAMAHALRSPRLTRLAVQVLQRAPALAVPWIRRIHAP